MNHYGCFWPSRQYLDIESLSPDYTQAIEYRAAWFPDEPKSECVIVFCNTKIISIIDDLPHEPPPPQTPPAPQGELF